MGKSGNKGSSQETVNKVNDVRLRGSFWQEPLRSQGKTSLSIRRFHINAAPCWRYGFCHFRDIEPPSKHEAVTVKPVCVEDPPALLSSRGPKIATLETLHMRQHTPGKICPKPTVPALRRSSRLESLHTDKAQAIATAAPSIKAQEKKSRDTGCVEGDQAGR